MRVFIGLGLSIKTKENLYDLQRAWLDHAIHKNPTNFNNFHLTLKYIGEINEKQIEELKYALDETLENEKSFKIKIGNIGSFVKGEKEIIWAGLTEGTAKLRNLQKVVVKAIIDANIPIKKEKYTPHITLGREVVFLDGVHHLPLINEIEEIKKVTMFRSHRINNELTYTPIFEFELR